MALREHGVAPYRRAVLADYLRDKEFEFAGRVRIAPGVGDPGHTPGVRFGTLTVEPQI